MELIRSILLDTIPRLKHGFFYPGLNGGAQDNFSFRNGSKEYVLNARERACGLLGIRHEHLTHVYQEHGSTIWNIGPAQLGAGAMNGEGQAGRGDAMIAQTPEIPLAILTADCLPIFFAHGSGQVVGLTHAGWRGTVEAIARKTVERLARDYGVAPGELFVWIGPGICGECFEVGEDVWRIFEEAWGSVNAGFHLQRRAIDLKEINRRQLVMAGVKEENIETALQCTMCDHRFFSYRRDGPGIGHNLAVIQRGRL
ncbi:MAG: polyphenol oxidase family protein [Candidatus Omnitrophota bacterium]